MQADNTSFSLYSGCGHPLSLRQYLEPILEKDSSDADGDQSRRCSNARPVVATRNLTLQNVQPATMRIAALITLLDVLVASGFSIASLVRPELIAPAGTVPSGASAIFAMYAAARTLPLAAAVMLAITMGSPFALLILGSLAGVIQGLDAIIGVLHGDLGKTIGPLVLAGLQAYAMLRLHKAMGPVGLTHTPL
jgi:hypothetical protein